MSLIEAMFHKSRGKPIVYHGRTLVMVDFFPTEGAQRFCLQFNACNGEWHQGVALNVDGRFEVDGKSYSGKRGIAIWYHEAPEAVEVVVVGNARVIQVKNVWDVGNGVMESWHNGAAMIVDEIANGRRYRCNDGFDDDDFDDIIFSIRRNEVSPTRL